MKYLLKENTTALVTGATSGIGRAFAIALAKRGLNLLIVSRSSKNLDSLSHDLRTLYSVNVRAIACDLGSDSGIKALLDTIDSEEIQIDVLINNAGSGIFGYFLASDVEKQVNAMRLNMEALVRLTHFCGKRMAAMGKGHILHVSSLGAISPLPSYSIYAATKVFVQSFSDALSFELRKSGVIVSTLLPGTTSTEFFTSSGQPPSFYQKISTMHPDKVVDAAIRGLESRKSVVTPGILNKICMAVLPLLPRSLMIRLGHFLMTF